MIKLYSLSISYLIACTKSYLDVKGFSINKLMIHKMQLDLEIVIMIRNYFYF